MLANNPPLLFFVEQQGGGLFARKISKFFPNDPGFGVFRNNPLLSKLFPEKKNSRPSAENVEQQGGLFAKGGYLLAIGLIV